MFSCMMDLIKVLKWQNTQFWLCDNIMVKDLLLEMPLRWISALLVRELHENQQWHCLSWI